MGIEPTSSAWKAEVLAVELRPRIQSAKMVEGGGFEPPKAEPADLQSAPFDRSGTPPAQSGKLQADKLPENLYGFARCCAPVKRRNCTRIEKLAAIIAMPK